MRIFELLLSLYFAVASVAVDLPRIDVKGNKFFYLNNGSQFYITGMAYQQNAGALRNNATGDVSTFVDPLADPKACKRDVEHLRKLATNTVRVYAVDTEKDHDECMKILAENHIYVILDLGVPDLSINRENPAWTVDLYERYKRVVEVFSKYSNVLGFFAGNEVSNNKTNTDASVFVKAAIRDTRRVISDLGLSLPVGYSANDDEEIRESLAQYFACGDLLDIAQMFGYNMYLWCGVSTYEQSGYKDRTEQFKNLGIPIFLSEYGCNTVLPREFGDIVAIFGPEMTPWWSGGIMYMYFQEPNNYGLVDVSGDSVSTRTDYPYYSLKINAISPSRAKASDVATSTATLSCPKQDDKWQASPILPPTPNKEMCDCVYNSLQCVVSDKLSEKDYAKLFGVVCGLVNCDDVSADGKKGKYGFMSPCQDKHKLSYVLNVYYMEQKRAKSACDFDGSASLVKLPSTDSSCSSIISSASQNSGATGSANGNGSGSSQGGGSDSQATKSTSSRKNSGSGLQPASTNSLAALLSLVLAVFGGITSFIV